MTSEQLKLTRNRLWLGITNVGFWVLVASGGLYLLAVSDAGFLDWRLGFLMSGAALAAQAVFDFLGGVWLRLQPRPTLTGFLQGWFRGVGGHTLVLIGVAMLSYASFRFSFQFWPAVLVASFGLAWGRRTLLHILTGSTDLRIADNGTQGWVATVDDPAFTGGIVGLDRRALSLLPARWWETLPKAELAVEVRRREWQIAKGLPGRAFILVLGWNLLGTWVGSTAFELARRPPTEALFGHACWMTLWAFGSLLILPAWSGQVVFASDRAAADSGLDPRPWISHFANLVGEDGSSNSGVQKIFYPIPSKGMRMRALESPQSGFIPGNLARSNLYYSWATLTPLGRAVHCNVGRPVLWVFPPTA